VLDVGESAYEQLELGLVEHLDRCLEVVAVAGDDLARQRRDGPAPAVRVEGESLGRRGETRPHLHGELVLKLREVDRAASG
jgi:hypothetical protein